MKLSPLASFSRNAPSGRKLKGPTCDLCFSGSQCCQAPVFVRISTEVRSIFRSTETQCTTAAETYGPHMGCIWATYGDLFCNIWSFFNIWGRKSFRKHNIWATYGSLFQTYGVLLKHIGPFWNIWGLSWKVFVSFSDLPHCIIPVWVFFFSKVLPITNQACSRYFCRRKTSVGSFRESLKPVFYHQSWNRKATAKISSWSCDCVSARSRAYYTDDARAPTSDCGLDLVWFFELRRGRLKSARMRKFKMSAARKDWSRRTTSKLELQLFLMSSSVFVACMPHRDDDRSTVTLTTRETRWCLLVQVKSLVESNCEVFQRHLSQ